MKSPLLAIVLFIGAHAAWAGPTPGMNSDALPANERARVCERMRDLATQAFFSREQGRPIKLFVEDGTTSTHIANQITRRIYDAPQIGDRHDAEVFGRDTCIELLNAKSGRK